MSNVHGRSAWKNSSFCLWAIGVLLAPAACQCRGERVTYELIPGESEFTGEVIVANNTMQPQKANGLTNRFEGALVLDFDGTNIHFNGESVFDSLLHESAPFEPPGSGEDNYGGHAFIVFSNLNVAARDLVLTLSGGSGGFGKPANTLLASFTSGKLDFVNQFPASSGSKPLAEVGSGANQATGLVQRLVDDIHETVTIPLQYSANYALFAPNDTKFTVNGEIVARRALADFDQDRDVDGGDFLMWQASFGSLGAPFMPHADADLDLDSDAADLAKWVLAFGATPSNTIVTAAVPEPAPTVTAACLGSWLATWLTRGRKRIQGY